jgi:hypothetical protein
MCVALLVTTAGCGGEALMEPATSAPHAPELRSESVPFHDHGVDLSFSGVFPCADAGVDIQAAFDYHIIVDVTFFPKRNVFRLFGRDVVLTHTNLETGSTVVQKGGAIETTDFDAGTFTAIDKFRIKGPDGKIILKAAGRLVFDADGSLIFESGQHEGIGLDFLNFVCTALA